MLASRLITSLSACSSLLLTVLCVLSSGNFGCISAESTVQQPDTQSRDADSGQDIPTDLEPDAGTDSDFGIPDLMDDTGSDLDADAAAIQCGLNEVPRGDSCICAEGFVEAPDGTCVICLDNSHCDGRVCAGYVCRNCLAHEECSPLFCGDDGVCTDQPPDCEIEGEQRCSGHVVEICRDESWVPDDAGACPFGCNEDTGDCYVDTNVGWIGGRCESATDCSRVDSGVVTCLPPEEGFYEGTCSQRCTSVCPDQNEATDTVTFCVDSEDLNNAGICVSRCDFALFSDTGCRPQYECRQMPRYASSSVSQRVCLPINWWRNPSRYFDYGVVSGEMTHESVIVWTHTGEVDGDVIVELAVGSDDDGLAFDRHTESRTTSEAGFAVQIELSGLSPATDYAYRFVVDDVAVSPVGHFRTAPNPGQGEPVRFQFSADTHQDSHSRDGIFETMLAGDPDFFLSLGDWPYADSATTVAQYRALHMKARNDARIHQYLRETPMVAIFDDHEVANDWDATYRANHPETVENGLQVWSEWFPLRRAAPGEFYRSFRWGDLEFFVLDARTHRDPRSQTDDDDKSMLGAAQAEWLLDALESSDAVFKLILTSVPLGNANTGSDSWLGYTTERDRLLTAITDGGIDGVVFLAGDQHWFGVHHYNTGFKELMACPLTAFLRTPPSTMNPEQIAILRDFNFGQIDYDPVERTLLFEAFLDDGALIYSELIRAGRGRIEVTANVNALFDICPRDMVGEDCAHSFRGVAPATFELAVPGPYEIVWQPYGGFTTPDSQRLTLEDGETITFDGRYGGVELPFVDRFVNDTGWSSVDEGTIEAPSDWELAELDGDDVLAQRSNIYDVNSTDPGPIDKLGTLVHNGSTTWTDYEVSVWVQATDNDGLGVIARYQDADNYYRFSLDNQRRFARLVARVDGDFFLLDEELAAFTAPAAPPYAPGVPFVLTLRVDGDQIDALIDDTLVLQATDSRLSSGAVGLYAWGSQNLYFDDVEVSAID